MPSRLMRCGVPGVSFGIGKFMVSLQPKGDPWRHMAMGQNPVPPVNIPIQPPKLVLLGKMSVAPTPKWDPKTALTTTTIYFLRRGSKKGAWP